MTQLAANLLLLDRVLAHYGPEATDARTSLRATAEGFAEVLQPGSGRRHGEFVLDQIQGKTDSSEIAKRDHAEVIGAYIEHPMSSLMMKI